MNTPTLETQRLLLRKFTAADLDALYEIFRDEEVNTFLPWLPLKSLDDARDFYEARNARAYRLPCAYRYAICPKAENIPIGYSTSRQMTATISATGSAGNSGTGGSPQRQDGRSSNR